MFPFDLGFVCQMNCRLIIHSDRPCGNYLMLFQFFLLGLVLKPSLDPCLSVHTLRPGLTTWPNNYCAFDKRDKQKGALWQRWICLPGVHEAGEESRGRSFGVL